jgi:hypothetical protein
MEASFLVEEKLLIKVRFMKQKYQSGELNILSTD